MVIWDTKMYAIWQLFLSDNKSPIQDNLLSFLAHEKPIYLSHDLNTLPFSQSSPLGKDLG